MICPHRQQLPFTQLPRAGAQVVAEPSEASFSGVRVAVSGHCGVFLELLLPVVQVTNNVNSRSIASHMATALFKTSIPWSICASRSLVSFDTTDYARVVQQVVHRGVLAILLQSGVL